MQIKKVLDSFVNQVHLARFDFGYGECPHHTPSHYDVPISYTLVINMLVNLSYSVKEKIH